MKTEITRTNGNRVVSSSSMSDILYQTYIRLKENKHLNNAPLVDIENPSSPYGNQPKFDSDDTSVFRQGYEASSTHSNDYHSMFYEIGI